MEDHVEENQPKHRALPDPELLSKGETVYPRHRAEEDARFINNKEN